MENIKAIKHIKKAETKWLYYFMALLKEGAYIKKQQVIIDNKEVTSYEVIKDFQNQNFSNIIYCNLNFKAMQKLKNIGFKIRDIKGKCYVSGNTQAYYFNSNSEPRINFCTTYKN